MAADLQTATDLLKAGRKAEAGAIFAGLVQADPNNELAWLGLSACIGPKNQKTYCLKQALRINPQNEYARNALAALDLQQVLETPAPRERPAPAQMGPPIGQRLSPPALESIPRPKKGNALGSPTMIAVGGVLVVLICVLTAMVGKMLLGGGLTNQTTLPSLAGPAATSTPWALSATSTPVHTCLTAQEYANRVVEIGTPWEGLLNEYAQLMSSASDDVSLTYDSGWRGSVESNMQAQERLANETLSLKPPRGFVRVDQEFKLAAKECLSFIDEARPALASLDAAGISRASEHVSAMNTHIEAAGREIGAAAWGDDSCP